MKQRVVVTGVGIVSPIGHDLETFWNAIKQGRSGIRPIQSFDATNHPVSVAAEVQDFDASELLSQQDIKHNARFIQFARVAARKAYSTAGLEDVAIDPYQIGVSVSSSVGGIESLEQAANDFKTSRLRVSPYLISNSLINLAAGMIAIDIQAKGKNQAIVTACASGTNSIGEAYKAIQRGEQTVILAGASEAAITPLALAGFAAMRALSSSTDPAQACSPFDSKRSGTVMGEGAAILTLESLDHALARGAPIIGEIVGYAGNCDAFSVTAPDPEGASITRVMQDALNDSGIVSSDIGYVNAHGTATILNDRAESRAISAVFGAKGPYVSSTKSVTGHLLGAGGAVEAVATILALQEGVVPPNSNLSDVDSSCTANIVGASAVSADLQYAMTNSFGFGGHNAALICKRWKR